MWPARRRGPSIRTASRPTGRAVRRRSPALEGLEERRLMAVRVTYQANAGDINFVISHPQVYTLYWGDAWQTDSRLVQQRNTLDTYLNFLTQSDWMLLMREYYWIGPDIDPVGKGRWRGRDLVSGALPSVVSDAQIKAMIARENDAQRFGVPDGDLREIAMVFLPPGVEVQEAKAHGWGAYHSWHTWRNNLGGTSTMTYAVMPWPNASYEPNSTNALAWTEIYASHELNEAMTNPGNGVGGWNFTGAGWYALGNQFRDGQGREIADLAAGANLKFGKYNGYWVQALWTNNSALADQRILPAGTTDIYARGNGKGDFPPGDSTGVGFDEDEDPLAGLIPVREGSVLYAVDPGTTLVVDAAAGVLDGFASPLGRPLTVRLHAAPEHGTLALAADGSFTYQPEAGYAGTDTFLVVAADGIFESLPTPVPVRVGLPAPEVIGPDGGEVDAKRPPLRWSAVAGATGYRLTLFDVTTGQAVAVPSVVAGTSWTVDRDLVHDHDYRWTVRALSGAGPGAESRAALFRVNAPPVGPIDLVGPADGAAVPLPSVRLRWTAALGAGWYKIDVFDSTAGRPLVDALMVAAPATELTLGGLADGHTYIWLVRATDPDRTGWTASPTWTFRADASVIEAPAMLAPADGAMLAEVPVTLRWGAVETAVGYQVLMWGDFGPLTLPDTAGTSMTVNLPRWNGSYSWAVLARNALGFLSPFPASPPTFRIEAPPQATSPGGDVPTRQPLLSWTETHPGSWGDSGYVVRVADSLGRTVDLAFTRDTAYWVGTSGFSFDPLRDGETYTWSVHPVDRGIERADLASAPRAFRVVLPPPAPVPIGPSGETSEPRPTFRWEPVAGATSYMLRIDDLFNPLLSQLVGPVTGTSATPDVALRVGRVYAWSVAARRGDVTGDDSPPLTVERLPLPAPAAIAPVGETAEARPAFRWGAVAGAASYNFRIDDLDDPSWSRLVASIPGTSVVLDDPLVVGRRYAWRVVAHDGERPGLEPATVTVTVTRVAAPPTPPPPPPSPVPPRRRRWRSRGGAVGASWPWR